MRAVSLSRNAFLGIWRRKYNEEQVCWRRGSFRMTLGVTYSEWKTLGVVSVSEYEECFCNEPTFLVVQLTTWLTG